MKKSKPDEMLELFKDDETTTPKYFINRYNQSGELLERLSVTANLCEDGFFLIAWTHFGRNKVLDCGIDNISYDWNCADELAYKIAVKRSGDIFGSRGFLLEDGTRYGWREREESKFRPLEIFK